jgi:transglutaminase-like putative cysteine protease
VPRLHAKHRTEIRYAGVAGESVNEIRLSPSDDGRQRVEWAHVRVAPGAELFGHRDVYGNDVRWFQLVGPHESLVVESEAVVVTRPAAALPSSAGAVGFAAVADPAYRESMAEFLAGSPHVRWTRPIGDFADALGLDPAWGVLAWIRALESAINARIVYTPGATQVDTPIEEVVAVGRGVCQDMAHLMIAICRRHGVAARYVSGWLYLPGHEGPGESHAWVEAAIPGVGWVELDPTHPAPVHEHYVRLATGRDYSDVPPLKGSYLGPATDEMFVAVELRELPS